MNKKAVAVFLALALLSSESAVVHATPTTLEQVQENRNSLMELEAYLGRLEDKIRSYDEDIINAQDTIAKNNEEIVKIKEEIKEAEKQIKTLKEEIRVREEILGGRFRSMYKSNRLSDYLAILLNCNDFSDFIAKIQALGRIVTTDQELINELEEKKAEAAKLQKKLEEENDRLVKLKEENEAKLKDLKKDQKEQQKLLDEAKEKRKAMKVDLTEQESELVAFPISVINSSSSSDNQIKDAIETLRGLRGDLVSPSVDEKVVQAIEKGKEVLAKREADRKAEEERKAKEEEEKKNQALQNANKPSSENNSISNVPVTGVITGIDIVNYAYRFLGTPYVWGGTTPDGFDCSGFTQYVYRHFGYNIGRTTYDQVYDGIAVSQSELQPGDLVLTSAGHIGIYVSDGRMIHAPQTGDVIKVSNIWSFYAARRIIR